MNASPIRKFDTIARQYRASLKKNPDTHIAYCLQQKNLRAAIVAAAESINHLAKIHPHQRRIGKNKLGLFSALLQEKELEISQSTTFEELLTIVETVKSKCIGELAHYDIAIRIGAYLSLFPDRIYLHSGTREGAISLLGALRGKKFITVNELPDDFRVHGFSEAEFEDILCRFKAHFNQPIFKNRPRI